MYLVSSFCLWQLVIILKIVHKRSRYKLLYTTTCGRGFDDDWHVCRMAGHHYTGQLTVVTMTCYRCFWAHLSTLTSATRCISAVLLLGLRALQHACLCVSTYVSQIPLVHIILHKIFCVTLCTCVFFGRRHVLHIMVPTVVMHRAYFCAEREWCNRQSRCFNANWIVLNDIDWHNSSLVWHQGWNLLSCLYFPFLFALPLRIAHSISRPVVVRGD